MTSMKHPGWITETALLTSSAKWDILLLPALYAFNCFTFSAWIELGQVATKPWLVLIWCYGLVALIPLLWRDRAPATVLGMQCLLTAAAWPINPHYTPAVGVPLALYAVSTRYSRKASLLALVASFVPNMLAASVAFRVYPDSRDQIASFAGNCVFLTVITIAAWAAGRVTQASARHLRKLQQERRTAREAVLAERRTIARELHDIISHAVAVIVWQAAGAGRIADTQSDQVKQSLMHIETTGRQAMTELQRLLGVLNASEPTLDKTGVGELGPQPGLRDLPELLASLRATGMPVTVHIQGRPQALDPSVDLAAYRIAQEGLTNALKHAGKSANPTLLLAWEVQQLMIQIDNDTGHHEMPRHSGLSLGRGLLGLRERVCAVGGTLHAGPQPHGSYRLVAILPLATHRDPAPLRSTSGAAAETGADQQMVAL
jgi:signal transduction histidine kinase